MWCPYCSAAPLGWRLLYCIQVYIIRISYIVRVARKGVVRKRGYDPPGNGSATGSGVDLGVPAHTRQCIRLCHTHDDYDGTNSRTTRLFPGLVLQAEKSAKRWLFQRNFGSSMILQRRFSVSLRVIRVWSRQTTTLWYGKKKETQEIRRLLSDEFSIILISA